MNYYIVVEGRCGEKIVYPQWIRYINNSLNQVYNIGDFNHNCFYIVSGNGYPNYLRIIDNSIDDSNSHINIDFLVIAVDSEEKTYEEKYKEIENYVGNRLTNARLIIIIQHPCLETWALGNRVVFRRNPEDMKLRQYLRFYNVRTNDPELLPGLPEEDLNRAQFSFSYLKRILSDRYPKITYTKSNPKAILHEKYFQQILLRKIDTNHIKSFSNFIDAFKIV